MERRQGVGSKEKRWEFLGMERRMQEGGGMERREGMGGKKGGRDERRKIEMEVSAIYFVTGRMTKRNICFVYRNGDRGTDGLELRDEKQRKEGCGCVCEVKERKKKSCCIKKIKEGAGVKRRDAG